MKFTNIWKLQRFRLSYLLTTGYKNGHLNFFTFANHEYLNSYYGERVRELGKLWKYQHFIKKCTLLKEYCHFILYYSNLTTQIYITLSAYTPPHLLSCVQKGVLYKCFVETYAIIHKKVFCNLTELIYGM